MNIKKVSKLISIFNIVFLCLICIPVIHSIFFSFFNLDIFLWSNLSANYNWNNIYEIFISISLVITAIVNIICSLQDKEDKSFNINHLIISIFTIIFLINKYIFLSNIIYNVINCIYIVVCMIATIMQLISVKSNSIVSNNEKKTSNIFIVLFILSTIILLVISSIYYYLIYSEVNKRLTYKNNIENNISANFEEYNGAICNEIKKNGKIGYTISGKSKIPCVYTFSSGFDTIYVDGNLYSLAIVIENGNYKLLSTNSNTIDLGLNPVDIVGWSDFEPLQRIIFLLQDNINSVNKQ